MFSVPPSGRNESHIMNEIQDYNVDVNVDGVQQQQGPDPKKNPF